MAGIGRKAEESAKTRAAILDAAEAIMRESGYAAVSARRVSDRAGANTGLIHYHFGNMDDLFLALFQRTDDEYFARYFRALSSDEPLRALWETHIDRAGNELIIEFLALANHRKAVRAEIVRSAERMRNLQVTMLAKILPGLGISMTEWPPEVVSLLLAGVSRTMVTEATLGIFTGHQEMLSFVERHLRQLQKGPQ